MQQQHRDIYCQLQELFRAEMLTAAGWKKCGFLKIRRLNHAGHHELDIWLWIPDKAHSVAVSLAALNPGVLQKHYACITPWFRDATINKCDVETTK